MLSYFPPLRRLLTRHKIVFSLQDGLSCLRRKLKTFIRTLKKGESRYEKIKSQLAKEMKTEEEIENRRSEIHQSWPQLVPLALKKKLLKCFMNKRREKLCQYLLALCVVRHLYVTPSTNSQ